jgi:hypothetical protein
MDSPFESASLCSEYIAKFGWLADGRRLTVLFPVNAIAHSGKGPSTGLIRHRDFWFFSAAPLSARMMSMDGDRCPVDPDAVAEEYLLGTLPKAQRLIFEEHYIGCPQCSERLQFTEDFVLAVRRAAARLRTCTYGGESPSSRATARGATS